jgi:hypothetical protein
VGVEGDISIEEDAVAAASSKHGQEKIIGDGGHLHYNKNKPNTF